MNRLHWISRKFSILMLVVAGLGASTTAWATCTINSGGMRTAYFTLGNVGWPRDAVIGKVFFTKIFHIDADFPNVSWRCDNASLGKPVHARLLAGGAVPGMPNVYQSGIPGIGIKFSRKTDVGGITNWTYFSYDWAINNYDYNFDTWQFKIELVKIADGVSSGTSNLIHLADYTADGLKLYDWWLNPFQINAPSCTVTTPSVTANLPDVSTQAFPAIGSTFGNANFKLSLQCSVGASLYVTLTDNTNASNQSDILSLTPGSGAAGVGFQILYKGNPVKYGPDSAAIGNLNQFYVGESPEGTYDIPLSTRYIRTERIVSPGIAQGRATFTMSYQ